MGKAIKQAKEIAAEIQENEQTATAAAAATEATQQEEPQELPAATLDELEGMDMAAFAYQEQPEGPREWRIADDSCADWAVCKIAEERAELARIKALAEEQIARIEEKWPQPRSAAKMAPVFSPQNSRNISRRYHTRKPRRSTATVSCPALWRRKSAA